jgi:tetratricopeptide (TPR) repeat protein
MNLRGQISNILHTETSWNVSEKSIEDYIDGTLEGELLDEFLLELKDNSDLMAEVELRKQVNQSIGESDIFNLRNELKAARELAEVKKVKMLIPESKISHVGFWRSSVAILIVLLGIGGVLRNSFISADRMYDKYFEAPAWSPERSLTDEITLLQRANISYLNGDFAQVINILDQVPESNIEYPVFDFYKAASFQRLDKLEEAISGYTRVINHGDNLFVEESEWYRSLCYLKTGNKEKAKTELLAVIERKGHFENDAKAVIRRLKYSMK